jgi:hypothetical protein
MNIEQLKEQIFHYTGKKVEVYDNDIKKVEKFIKQTEDLNRDKSIDELIDIIRHDLYLYYQYNYNMESTSYNNSHDKKRLLSHKD